MPKFHIPDVRVISISALQDFLCSKPGSQGGLEQWHRACTSTGASHGHSRAPPKCCTPGTWPTPPQGSVKHLRHYSSPVREHRIWVSFCTLPSFLLAKTSVSRLGWFPCRHLQPFSTMFKHTQSPSSPLTLPQPPHAFILQEFHILLHISGAPLFPQFSKSVLNPSLAQSSLLLSISHVVMSLSPSKSPLSPLQLPLLPQSDWDQPPLSTTTAFQFPQSHNVFPSHTFPFPSKICQWQQRFPHRSQAIWAP